MCRIIFNLYLFLVCVSVSIYAEEDVPFFEIDRESIGIVDHHVNVISGNFFDRSIDLKIEGPEVLSFERHYSSSNSYQSDLFRGFETNHECLIKTRHPSKVVHDKCHNTKYIDRDIHRIEAHVVNQHGRSGIYEGKIPHGNTKSSKLQFRKDSLLGYTNFGKGDFKNRNHIKNSFLKLDKKTKGLVYQSEDGSKMRFKKYDESGYWKHKHLVIEDKRPSGCKFLYEYTKELLHKIELVNRSKTESFGSIVIHQKTEKELRKDPKLTIESSDGRQVVYEFNKTIYEYNDYFTLTKVIRPDAPYEKYEYSKHQFPYRPLVKRKSMPEGRSIKIKYIGNKIKGVRALDYKVKQLLKPVGVTEKPVVVYEFEYKEQLDEDQNLIKGQTKVYDAERHLKKYRYNQDFRIDKVEKYLGTSSHKLFSKERFYWTDEGDLLCHTIEDRSKKIHGALAFQYDVKGNLEKQTLYGNLTGARNSIQLISQGSIPKISSNESYSIKYVYSKNHRNLLKKEIYPNGKVVKYKYKKDRSEIIAKYIQNHSDILIREFFEYDANGLLVTHIIDDGSAKDQHDLTKVTERSITKFINQSQIPVGLPIEITKYYLDLETGEEKVLSTIKNEYTLFGKISKKSIFNENHECAFSQEFKYDAHQNVIYERNHLGDEIYRSYNKNDELVEEVHPQKSFKKRYKYDFVGRCILEEEEHSDGTIQSISYLYNKLSQLVEKRESNGEETKYTYDDLGRLIETKFPTYVDPSGIHHERIQTTEYDFFGHPVKFVDFSREVTLKEFNLRGKPTLIVYPNGSKESFEYYLDGLLKQATLKNGLKIKYEYDVLNRLVREEEWSENGVLLSYITKEYNAFHLISETDKNGVRTEYAYYPNGHLKSIRKDQSFTEFEYDACQRLYRKIQWVNENEAIVHVTLYDALNRIIEERDEDLHSKVFQLKKISYDRFGFESEIISFIGNEESKTNFIHNSYGEIVEKIDSRGNVTKYFYNRHQNQPIFEKGLEITEIDPKGIQTIICMNVYGKPESIIKKDSFQNLLAKKELWYNEHENLVLVKEAQVFKGQILDVVSTSWVYDQFQNLSKIVEALDSKDHKETLFRYNDFGQKVTTIKPDGSLIYHEYDERGFLKFIQEASKTSGYDFRYDLNGNLISSKNLASGQTIQKKYNSLGHVIEEDFGNGLVVQYALDWIGRPSVVTLPDQSKVLYRYNPIYLKEVERLSKDGKQIGIHRYISYDLSGNLLEEGNSFHQETNLYRYNLESDLVEIKTSFYEEAIQYNAFNELVHYEIKNSLKDVIQDFSYDLLSQIDKEKGIKNHEYENDSLYNCLSRDGHLRDVNALNQLLKTEDKTYEFDGNGNRISDGILSCSYDFLDRLVKVEKENQSYHYEYDSLNRRLSKTLKDLDGNVINQTFYLYLDKNEVGSFDENHQMVEFRTLGTGKGAEIGATLFIEKDQHVYFPLHDHNGNIITLIDSETLEAVESYRYSAFGEERIYNQIGEEVDSKESLNPWRFSSKRVDSETGYLYFGRRFYDPEVGRWINKDPKGFEAGPNLYAYVFNTPLNRIDLYGLEAKGGTQGFVSRVRDHISNFISDISRRTAEFFRDIFSGSRSNDSIRNASNDKESLEENEKSLSFYIRSMDIKCIILFVNGMNTTKNESIDHQNYIKSLNISDDVEVLLLYNETRGFLLDFIEAFRNVILKQKTYSCRRFTKSLKDIFDKVPEDVHFLIIGHSQGTALMNLELEGLSEDRKQRTHLVAVAPSAYISKENYGSVTHLVSERDLVPLVDYHGRNACLDTTKVLKPHKDAPWFDHGFQSPTYEKHLRNEINKFVDKYN